MELEYAGRLCFSADTRRGSVYLLAGLYSVYTGWKPNISELFSQSLKQKKIIASAGNKTRVNCLEGSYAHHYTTDALM